MRFQIKHKMEGRLRVHLLQERMSFEQADIFEYCLKNVPGVTGVKVYECTADAVICFDTETKDIYRALHEFSYEKADVPAEVLANSGREMNAKFKEKLLGRLLMRFFMKAFVPAPISTVVTVARSVSFIYKGLKSLAQKKLEVPVLDATAIGVSIIRGNTDTAGSVMFMLDIGEILEEWTHKKSVGDLVRTMSLNIEKVWTVRDGQEMLVDSREVESGDLIICRMGNLIPFDGDVVSGDAMVNQASMTGEGLPVRKTEGGYVYAGTAVEEGEIIIKVRESSGSTRYEKIVKMIENSERLKSGMESKAEHLADRLVPYTFLGTLLVWLFTRNITKALSVLMVDFSCALKLAMPVTVLSAIREASEGNISVKGGKFLEAIAEADAIVFDKTGTLTKAEPRVREIVRFDPEENEDDLLRLAACLEEHFPHSVAKAVVRAAEEKGLKHEEMHSKVDYIVAHGIASRVAEKRVVIGSYHFVFEDEKCVIRDGFEELFEGLPKEYSHLYMAVDGKLEAVICIEDPMREEAARVISELRREGFEKLIMMTGDSERTAAAIASRVGVDEYYSEVLPEDKAQKITELRTAGHTVVMVGDGINDSPALSAADVGIAISNGAAIAREIADITINADDLNGLVTLKRLSKAMVGRIKKNYRSIIGINGTLIALGVAGVIQPAASAFVHNASTILIGAASTRKLLPEE